MTERDDNGREPLRFPAWVDGRMVAPGEPAISPFDQGFTLGLAVFETMLVEEGWRYFEREHLERLREGARWVGIEWPPPIDPAWALHEYCTALGPRDFALRLTLTRGVPGQVPTMVVTGRALSLPPPEGVVIEIAESDGRVFSSSGLENVKSTNRLRNLMARERALANGSWDALLVNDEGDVVEGTISNAFAVRDGALLTASIDRGCLPGIMRALVLEEAREAGLEVREDRLEVEDLRRAQEVFLTNTTGRLTPVLAVRGLVDGLAGPEGTVLRALAERVRARESQDRAR